MTKDEIVAICEAMGWHTPLGSAHRDGWVVCSCPLAPWRHGGGKDANPSFAISFGDTLPHCVCLACDYSGTLPDLLLVLIQELTPGTPLRKQAVKIMQGLPTSPTKGPLMPVKTKTKIIHDPLFPDVWLEQFPRASESAKPLKYLMGRGITNVMADAMDIRYDPKYERIGFPIRDWSGQLRGMQGRVLDDEQKPKYLFYKWDGVSCGHQVLLGEATVDTEKPVILVEGVFDFAALFPYTKQVMVLWGSRVTPSRVARLARCLKIYTAFDTDMAGNKAREAIKDTTLPVTNLMLPETVKDVGELGAEGLKNLASHVDSYGSIR